jgi:uncharacterized repeat protein (TIGR02543 family)
MVAATLVVAGSLGFVGAASATPSTGPAVNVTAPTITDATNAGLFYAGDVLSTSTGTWSSDQGIYTYQWYSCTDTPSGNPVSDNNCSAISGATASTYQLQTSDIGNMVTVNVSDEGTNNSFTAASASAVGPAITNDINFTCVPGVSAYNVSSLNVAPNQNFHLTITGCDYYIATGTTTNLSNPSNGAYVSGATEVMDVTGTANVWGYTVQPVEDAQIWYFTALGPAVNTVAPTVSDDTNTGDFYNGDSLSANVGTWTSDTSKFTYQWYTCTDSPIASPANDSNCTELTGQTGSSYTLQSSDLGHTVTFTMTDSGTDGSTTSAYSAPSPVVTANPSVPATNSELPVISDTTTPGANEVGDTLSTTTGTWTNDTGTYTYQWYSCASAPSGDPATAEGCTAVGSNEYTYVVQSSDVGNVIVVDVTGQGIDSSTTTATSAPTDAVPQPLIDDTVSFSAGTGTGSVSPVSVVNGASFVLPSSDGLTAPAGYVFTGWSYGEQNYQPGDSVTITSDETFTAYWTAVSVPIVTLTYGPNGSAHRTVHRGQTITLPRTSGVNDANCTLEGWSNGVKTFAPGSVFTATKNTTLSAVWGACQYKKSGTVFFELNSSKLSASAETKVFALAATMKKHDLHHATILGYTDSIGSALVNLVLSKERASSVAAYLTSSLKWLGVTDVVVTVKGLGASHFISSDSTNGINRRATIEVRS